MRKQRLISLCLALALALSLAACNSPTDEQTSAQPTASTQPTTAPTPTPTPLPIPYTDVAEDSPYYDAVVWAYKNGIASDGETFGPADACTRGQVMTFLWRAKGSPEPQTTESPFGDVSSADWFYKPALWASENGIASGTAFNPGNPCTNAEALTFLWRAEGKPAASVYHSTVALAASGQYYERPAAWAEVNGLFAGAEFDPAAPCSRAELMMYLQWVAEEWTFTEEDRAAQAEFEQMINDAQLFEVHGSGLCYADYVDVDNDGKVELLTVDSGEDLSIMNHNMHAYNVTATVYASVDGHAEKLCEETFTFSSGEESLYLWTYDGHVSFHYSMFLSGAGYYDDFYTIENGAFVVSDSISELLTHDERGNIFTSRENAVSEAEYNAIMEKYTDGKNLFNFNRFDGISVKDRGLLPSREEYEAAQAQRWANHWAKIDPAYAAVLRGDFSAFVGTYGDERVNFSMDKNGVLTSNNPMFAINRKPLSVTITEKGVINCVLIREKSRESDKGNYIEQYDIYPIGVESEPYYNSQIGEEVSTDSSKIRIFYSWSDVNWANDIPYEKVS